MGFFYAVDKVARKIIKAREAEYVKLDAVRSSGAVSCLSRLMSYKSARPTLGRTSNAPILRILQRVDHIGLDVLGLGHHLTPISSRPT
jgi:hypothetical protein